MAARKTKAADERPHEERLRDAEARRGIATFGQPGGTTDPQQLAVEEALAAHRAATSLPGGNASVDNETGEETRTEAPTDDDA